MDIHFKRISIVVAIAGILALTASAGTNLVEVSSDVYSNSTSQHKSEVEPHTVAFGTTIVSGFQVGRFFDGGGSNIGWSTSNDGGRTWDHGFLPGITKFEGGGTYDRVSDASVAYSKKFDVWLISSLPIQDVGGINTPEIIVSRSTDGGHHWGNPITVNTGSSLDKNWTVCDNWVNSPFFGNCYTEYDDGSNTIFMSTSSDGGLTWSPAKTTGDHARGIGGQPLVQANGQVVVPIAGVLFGMSSIVSFSSTDGGKSWSSTVNIADVQSADDPGGLRDGPLPTAAVDGSGKIFVVWSDCRFESGCAANDLVMSSSVDGKTWSQVGRIPISAANGGAGYVIPGLGIDPTTSGVSAHMILSYYYYPSVNCTPADCQLMVGYVSSVDGGAHWSANNMLAGPMSLSWIPKTSQGEMVGDYMATVVSNGSGFPLFALATAPPSSGVFNQGMFVPALGLKIAGGIFPIEIFSGAPQTELHPFLGFGVHPIAR